MSKEEDKKEEEEEESYEKVIFLIKVFIIDIHLFPVQMSMNLLV